MKLDTGSGFTLIEVLISLIVFSLMMGIAAYSFRFYVGMVDKVIMPYPEKVENFSKLRSAVNSLFYFVGEKKDILGKSHSYYFFYGHTDSFTFVSAKPILSDELSVCKIYIKNNKLIWEESPVYSRDDNYKMPKITNPKTMILFKDVQNVHFSYFLSRDREVNHLKEDIPSLIKITFQNERNKRIEFDFYIKSNCEKKKNFTQYLYDFH